MAATLELFRVGGAVLWLLLGLSVVMWCLMVSRWMYLRREGDIRPGLAADLVQAFREHGGGGCVSLLAREGGLLARLLETVFDTSGGGVRRRRIDQCVAEAVRRLTGWCGPLAALVQAAPLLGLLGTVLGMVETFEVLRVMGTSEPAAVARGISRALLTSEAGLLVALPGLVGASRIRRRENIIAIELERLRLVLAEIVE